MALRFRGFLPVVVDVRLQALIAVLMPCWKLPPVFSKWTTRAFWYLAMFMPLTWRPLKGPIWKKSALEFTGIDPFNPLRDAKPEEEALNELFRPIRKTIKSTGCNRAILVGHNAFFDHSFLFAAAERADIKRNPFHPFSTLDTASLSALAVGHTVLSRSCQLAGIDFDNRAVHSAAYDTLKTAELFCEIVNRWKNLGGWLDEI